NPESSRTTSATPVNAATRRVRSERRARLTGSSDHIDGSFRIESVSDAAHRIDADRGGELLAHLRDVDVDRPRVAEPVVAPYAVDLGVARGQEDDGDRGGLAQPAAHFEAVDVGKADVEHDEPGPVRADRGRDLFARRGLDHPEPVAPEVELDQIRDVRFVVDDEDRASLHVLSIVPFSIGEKYEGRVRPPSGLQSTGPL